MQKNVTLKHNILEKRVHALIIMIALLILIQALNVTGIGTGSLLTKNMSIGVALLIGIVASISSCTALVGGLLLSISANYSERHPHASKKQKMIPLASFIIGRLGGYFLFGGITGAIGKSLSPSLMTMGIIDCIIAMTLIIIGLRIVHLLPQTACTIVDRNPLTTFLTRLSTSQSNVVLMMLGMLTFFVPCGYTQTMQLTALASGGFLSGALLMLSFAVGNAPSLIGIGSASALATGRGKHFIVTFAGSMALVLGLQTFGNGLSLMGIILPHFGTSIEQSEDPNVTIDKNGQQVINISVTNSGYSANDFVIEKGKSTWILADVLSPLSGCITQLAVPAFDILHPLTLGQNWIGPFTPTEDFVFSCSMGMYRSTVRVR